MVKPTASETTNALAKVLSRKNMFAPELEEDMINLNMELFAQLLREDTVGKDHETEDDRITKDLLKVAESYLSEHPPAEATHADVEQARQIIKKAQELTESITGGKSNSRS